MKQIIGIAGKRRIGKDTNILTVIGYEKMSFASSLNEAAKLLFDFTDEQLNDPKQREALDDKLKTSPAKILQWLGEDILNHQTNIDFFLNLVKTKILQSKNNIVITDLRFDTEAKLIKELGGKIIKIVESKHEKTETLLHSNKFDISPEYIDEIIINNGTKEELFKKVEDFRRKAFLLDC